MKSPLKGQPSLVTGPRGLRVGRRQPQTEGESVGPCRVGQTGLFDGLEKRRGLTPVIDVVGADE